MPTRCNELVQIEEDAAAYFAGEKLRGDDFTPEQIEPWFAAEQEGYAEILDVRRPTYPYHGINERIGFRALGDRNIRRALGVGSAFGDEFKPIADRIEELVIVDPSDRWASESVHGIPATYVKPEADGQMVFPDHHFDLAVAFGVLHHIPNVSDVVAEVFRTLEPGGIFLIREPSISMGDWRGDRGPNLTKNERGIPPKIMDEIATTAGFSIIKHVPVGCRPILLLGRVLGRNPHATAVGAAIDCAVSSVLNRNHRYHAETWWHKLSPGTSFLVLERPRT